MKMLRVKEDQCSGCGLCFGCGYVQENSDGNAEVILGKVIREKDLKKIESVIADCPEQALYIEEVKGSHKKGRDALKEIVEEFRISCKGFSIQEVKDSDLPFDTEKYKVDLPGWDIDHPVRKEYKSEREARNAAEREFRRVCYQESAYEPMLRKLLVEYKVNELRPYYTSSDTNDSAYYPYNQQIRKLLAETYAKIDDILGDQNPVPPDWKDFSFYLHKSDVHIRMLAEFERRSNNLGIMTEFKDLKYHQLSDYMDMYTELESYERYDGEGLFGRTKYKTVWTINGFYDATVEFVNDLNFAVRMRADVIQEQAIADINRVLHRFEQAVREKLLEKASQLENDLQVKS